MRRLAAMLQSHFFLWRIKYYELVDIQFLVRNIRVGNMTCFMSIFFVGTKVLPPLEGESHKDGMSVASTRRWGGFICRSWLLVWIVLEGGELLRVLALGRLRRPFFADAQEAFLRLAGDSLRRRTPLDAPMATARRPAIAITGVELGKSRYDPPPLSFCRLPLVGIAV